MVLALFALLCVPWFVLINQPGSAVVRGAPDDLVAEVITACCQA